MYDLKDKVVLITGAAGGLGSCIVRLLMQEGVKHVALVDVAKVTGESFQDELNTKYGANKTKFYECDITDEAACLRVLDDVKSKQGYIDLVINNAGIMNDSWQTYKKEILVNVLGLVTISLRALEMMRKDEGGRGGTIINISSAVALTQEYPLLPIYGATKSAVLQFSNLVGLKDYYAMTGVRVIAVCPGITDTTLLSPEKAGTFDKNFAKIVEKVVYDQNTMQSPESAAQAIMDVYKRGETGSTFVVAKGEPPKDISSDVKKAYDILAVHTVL